MRDCSNNILTILHTSKVNIFPFDNIGKEILTGVEVIHLLNEGLLLNLKKYGYGNTLTKMVYQSVQLAEGLEATCLLSSCNSISQSLDIISSMTNIPIIKIEYPMCLEAIKYGEVIGIVGTINFAIENTKMTLKNVSIENKKEIVVIPRLVEKAFDALINNDIEQHNKLIINTIDEMYKNAKIEVILLAQASMYKIEDYFKKEEFPIKIFSSPRIAIKYISNVYFSNIRRKGEDIL